MEVKPFYDSRGRVREFMQRHRIGLLTLVFTDIVGSVNLKRVLGDGAAVELIQQHHARLRELLARFNEGEEIDTAGDSFLVVFSKPSDAVHFALSFQSALRSLSAETGVGIKDRVGIHVGEVFIADSGHTTRRKDLFGIQVDTCARVMSLGGADQILMTQFAFDNARHVLLGQTLENLSSILWLKHGLYEFNGVAEPLEVCEVGEQGVAALKAPADTGKAKRHASDSMKQPGWRPAAGQSVPGLDWRLEAKLGEGGFGEVWRAARDVTGELAAFKFSFRNDGRFFLENAWKASQKLLQSGGRHPGIVEIYAAQLDQEPCSLRLELVAGSDLAAWCAARGGPQQIRLGVRVDVVVQVAEALQHAHLNGVTHKDLKPSNILISGKGRQAGDLQVKLTDFGFWHEKPLSAEASHRTTTFIGSPLYLSPEQAAGKTQVGPAADIYALGLIFYELLTGRPPFVRASFSEIMDAHRYEDARLPSQENPEVPNGLERICLKAMEKRPQDRYGSAMEMAEELRRFTRGERIATRPKQYDNVIASRIRRHIDELKTWRRDQLLTDQEFAGVARAYSQFDRAGLEAVMEGRRLHSGLLLLLAGGWLILDGCSLWLAVQPDLERGKRILIGWFPVAVTNGLWALFWRHGSYRAAHIMMLLGSISLPMGIGILLNSMHWLETSIGDPSITLDSIQNAQVLTALIAATVWTALLGWRTRTVLISALCAAFAAGVYTVILDFANLQKLWDTPANLALRTLPFALVAVGTGTFLGRLSARRRQSFPWFAGALAVLVLATLTMAWKGPEDWLMDQTTKQFPAPETVLQGLLLAACAGIYFPAGLILRRWHLVSARAAYSILLWLSPICFLGGLELMAHYWPANFWPHPIPLFGAPIQPLHLALGALSFCCILSAAAMQIRTYAFVGLAFMTVAEWEIGLQYVDSKNAGWAISLLVVGTLLTAAIVLTDIRNRVKSSREDMDDVAERLNSTPDRKETPAHSEDPLRL